MTYPREHFMVGVPVLKGHRSIRKVRTATLECSSRGNDSVSSSTSICGSLLNAALQLGFYRRQDGVNWLLGLLAWLSWSSLSTMFYLTKAARVSSGTFTRRSSLLYIHYFVGCISEQAPSEHSLAFPTSPPLIPKTETPGVPSLASLVCS